MSKNEDRFFKQVKKTLDLGTDHLNAETQSRLTQIRYKALESKSSRWFPEWMYQPTAQWTSVACTLLLIVLYFAEPDKFQEPSWEDVDLLASTDVLELYEELEFYAWLAEENVDAG
jgi:hypothetical protein